MSTYYVSEKPITLEDFEAAIELCGFKKHSKENQMWMTYEADGSTHYMHYWMGDYGYVELARYAGSGYFLQFLNELSRVLDMQFFSEHQDDEWEPRATSTWHEINCGRVDCGHRVELQGSQG